MSQLQIFFHLFFCNARIVSGCQTWSPGLCIFTRGVRDVTAVEVSQSLHTVSNGGKHVQLHLNAPHIWCFTNNWPGVGWW